MPLTNVYIKNFKLDSFIVTDETSLQTYHELWQQGDPSGIAGNVNPAGQSNTLPRSVLITLNASSLSADNPNGGGEGYWSFGTKDLKIGDCTTWGINNPDCVENSEGIESGKWLFYVNYTDPVGAYYTHPACPLKNMEFDPGGGCHVSYWSSSGHYPTSVTKIGHDFWKSKLQGEYMGEPYEPTIGEPVTYYRHWSENHNPIVSGFLWDDVVKHVTAVNSMPLNADGTAQQGNKVYCIVTLKYGVTGQDIVDLGGVVRVNFNGSPTFVSTEDPNTDTGNNTWNDSVISDYTDGTIFPNETNDNNDINSDNLDGNFLDGVTGVIADDQDFTIDFVDSGISDSDIDSYTTETDNTSTDDSDGDGVDNTDDTDYEGGVVSESTTVAVDNPNTPDEPLGDVTVPNASDYDTLANSQANESTEDESATSNASGTGIQDSAIEAMW
tara:strand:+ start:1335 stop:2654 length:1320 start_codon:yes stop_codon:yes gene_type:complete